MIIGGKKSCGKQIEPCSECGEFSHIERGYCENCGSQNTIRSATSKDYEKVEANKCYDNSYHLAKKPDWWGNNKFEVKKEHTHEERRVILNRIGI